MFFGHKSDLHVTRLQANIVAWIMWPVVNFRLPFLGLANDLVCLWTVTSHVCRIMESHGFPIRRGITQA